MSGSNQFTSTKMNAPVANSFRCVPASTPCEPTVQKPCQPSSSIGRCRASSSYCDICHDFDNHSIIDCFKTKIDALSTTFCLEAWGIACYWYMVLKPDTKITDTEVIEKFTNFCNGLTDTMEKDSISQWIDKECGFKSKAKELIKEFIKDNQPTVKKYTK